MSQPRKEQRYHPAPWLTEEGFERERAGDLSMISNSSLDGEDWIESTFNTSFSTGPSNPTSHSTTPWFPEEGFERERAGDLSMISNSSLDGEDWIESTINTSTFTSTSTSTGPSTPTSPSTAPTTPTTTTKSTPSKPPIPSPTLYTSLPLPTLRALLDSRRHLPHSPTTGATWPSNSSTLSSDEVICLLLAQDVTLYQLDPSYRPILEWGLEGGELEKEGKRERVSRFFRGLLRD